MRAQVTSAVTGMTQPTGWHYHVCEGQFVYTLKGWVELEFEDGTNCRLEAGDSVFIPGGLIRRENGTSDDLEILEVSLPGESGRSRWTRRQAAPTAPEACPSGRDALAGGRGSLMIRGDAGVAQWQSRSFPSLRRGFDSLHPLQ